MPSGPVELVEAVESIVDLTDWGVKGGGRLVSGRCLWCRRVERLSVRSLGSLDMLA